MALKTTLRSCKKMSDLVIGEWWSMLVFPLMDTPISTSFGMELWAVVDVSMIPIVLPYTAAVGDNFMLINDNCRLYRVIFVDDIFFEEEFIRMEFVSVFSGDESNRACLEQSKEICCWLPTTSTYSRRTGNISLGWVGQNTKAPH